MSQNGTILAPQTRIAATRRPPMGERPIAVLVAKRLVLGLALVLAGPLIAFSRVGNLLGGDGLFHAGACFVALLPGKFGSYLRLAFYVGTLQSISPDVYIDFGSFFTRPEAVVGSMVAIGPYCVLGKVDIEDGVLLASRVSVPSGSRQHMQRFDPEAPSEDTVFERVRIGKSSWIGEGAIVMADIGEGSIVAAGSVVNRAMPPRSLVAGNPARRIGDVVTALTPPR